jgi:hypothetical protein
VGNEAASVSTPPSPASVPQEKTPKPVPGETDYAALLIAVCGPPSRDHFTENEIPRPLIPIRIIEYKERGVQFSFVSGTPLNEPTSKWQPLMVSDIDSHQMLEPGDLKEACFVLLR